MSFYGQKYIWHHFQDNESEILKDLVKDKKLIINWIFSAQKKGFHLHACILNEETDLVSCDLRCSAPSDWQCFAHLQPMSMSCEWSLLGGYWSNDTRRDQGDGRISQVTFECEMTAMF